MGVTSILVFAVVCILACVFNADASILRSPQQYQPSGSSFKSFYRELINEVHNDVANRDTQIGGAIECALCKVIVAKIDEDVFKDEGALLKYLEGLCHHLPPPTDQVCVKAFDTEVPKWWDEFFKMATPDNICELLKLCSTNTAEANPLYNVIPQNLPK